ncbi:hypothetical protein GGR56DRAFT_373802 [Xylariaceae sp. FL0804]|nr:hypothetical protein GGR56DRAFT_373802 [Xylariaceae sp. FL0804]
MDLLVAETMDLIEAENDGPGSPGAASTTASTTSTSTIIVTPDTASRRSSITTCAMPEPTPLPPGPLPVTLRSVTSWRTPYPAIGQFAAVKDDVVAVGPNGPFSFERLQGHASRPWTEPQPFGQTLAAILNSSPISGITLCKTDSYLYVYCVSGGKLHAFRDSDEGPRRFEVDPDPPIRNGDIKAVCGTPAVSSGGMCFVVPCHSGGLLLVQRISHVRGVRYIEAWSPICHGARNLGMISAVSAVFYQVDPTSGTYYNLLVCIASGHLHAVKEDVYEPSSSHAREPKSTRRIHHPGEVTGNPVLIRQTSSCSRQLDLLVPSAEGGIFHFVRITSSGPDEWQMIGRIAFPSGVPPATCLAFDEELEQDGYGGTRRTSFRALVQCGGRLYQLKTDEGARPWSGSYLNPIIGPGPFYD